MDDPMDEFLLNYTVGRAGCSVSLHFVKGTGRSFENNRIQCASPLAMDHVYSFSKVKSTEFTLK